VPLGDAMNTMSNARIIYAGKNNMPPFGSVYTAEEILDAGAYCATFAENLAG